MEIICVDGRPVEEVIQRKMLRVTASTPAYARYLAVLNLLHGPRKEKVTVEFSDGLSLPLDRQLYTPNIYYPAVISHCLEGNIGYLRIPHFGKSGDLVAQFDSALDALRDTRALIIDVRSNPGGYTRIAAKLAGRFFRTRTVFTNFTRKQYLLGIGIKVPGMVFPVNPRGKWLYLRPIVVLTDPLVFSSAEYFAAGMKDTGRAVLVGQTTAGASGNPKKFHAGPLYYRVSTWREYRRDGRLIEGHGIEPDIPVVPTPEDLRAGTDSTLQAALTYLSRTRPVR